MLQEFGLHQVGSVRTTFGRVLDNFPDQWLQVSKKLSGNTVQIAYLAPEIILFFLLNFLDLMCTFFLHILIFFMSCLFQLNLLLTYLHNCIALPTFERVLGYFLDNECQAYFN